MYTTIPHQDLLDKMKQVTEEVFKIAKLNLGCNDDETVVLYVGEKDEIKSSRGIYKDLKRQSTTTKMLTGDHIMF